MFSCLQDIAALASKVIGVSLRDTVRTFICMVLGKSLALQFSWSGLAEKRKPLKLVFKDHAIYELLQSKHDTM